jgi:cell division transport system ATP-binding protein
MIKFQNITKTYSPNTIALDDVSFEVKEGEFVSIVGKSGAGKTTLVRLLLALEKPTFGEIFFKEINVHKIKPSQIQELRRKIGVVYQDYKLLSTKTVYENIAYVLAVKGEENRRINQKVPKILELTGLEEKSNNFPGELSGGEQQRVAIARAIVTQPEVLVADEPTGNLDPYNTHEVISLLKKINKMGKTVILATHDKEIINKLGQRVISLGKGKVIRDDENGHFVM